MQAASLFPPSPPHSHTAIIYGAHVSTTMVPILADIFFGSQYGPHSLALAGIYIPYLVIPFCIMLSFALDSDPFRNAAAKRKTA